MKMRKLILALLLLALPAFAAGGFKARGFFLPDGAVKVDEDRYRLPQAWEDAAKWYRATYPPAKYPRHTLKNQSGVRAMHITNPNSGEWEGANLYETPRGEVRVFVLGRGEKPAEPSPPLPAPKAKQQPPARR